MQVAQRTRSRLDGVDVMRVAKQGRCRSDEDDAICRSGEDDEMRVAQQAISCSGGGDAMRAAKQGSLDEADALRAAKQRLLG
ncbi:hypothetical protein NDU88_000886 [Pleurodeles waltl]|uniref:Uncharacterized protein n=1 Tax=Pleurodeles waltl TaxID=8319 RepID=A0AAV7UR86_PLEWA|nr:hypothetical protein NDU88_000886 [Pleurodeles waltl]